MPNEQPDPEIEAAINHVRSVLEGAKRDRYWGDLDLTFGHRDGKLTGEVRTVKRETRKLFPAS